MSILKFKNLHKDKSHEEIFKLYHNLNEPPKCYCGDYSKFISFVKGYELYCCSDCKQKKEKYNIENILYLLQHNDGIIFNSYDYKQIKKFLNLSIKDIYLIKNPNAGKCEVCSKETNFINNNVGFLKTCSYECGNSLPRRKLTKEEKDTANCKRKITNKEKYGVEYNFQLLDYSGDKNPMKNPDIVKKQQTTMEQKYGDIHALNIPEFKEKAKKTSMLNFGVDCVLKLPYFSEESMMKKYNVPYAMQSEMLVNRFKQSRLDNLSDRRVNDAISGFVYILYFVDKELIKIGMTGNFNNRCKQLSSDFGEFEVLVLLKTNNCYELETKLHKRFHKNRVILDEGCGKTEFFNINKENLFELPAHLDYEFLIGKELTSLI